MSSEYETRNDHSTAALMPAILPNGALSSSATSTESLSDVIVRIVVIEFLAVAGSAYLASGIYHYTVFGYWPAAQKYVFATVFIASMVLLSSLGFRHFTGIQTQPRHKFVWSGFGAVVLAFSIFLSTLFLLKVAEGYSRGAFLSQVVGVGIVMVGTRAILYWWLLSAIASARVAARRVVMIGDQLHCARLTERLKLTGILTVGWTPFPTNSRTLAAAHGEADFSSIRPGDRTVEWCRKIYPDDIIIVPSSENIATIPDLTRSLCELPINVHVVPLDPMHLLATSRIAEFGNIVTFQVSRCPLSTYELFIKRAFDVAAATAGLVALSPLLVMVAVAIKLDSPGPVFFRQTRHGYNNQTIKVLKFRSMKTADPDSRFEQAKQNDTRVTRVGRILRHTNLDELPQLVNVLLGEMSIVGPRPHAIAHNEMFMGRISPFSRRHNVKPGMTGWAQVNGLRGETDTLEKMKQRIQYDLYYIEHWSFLFDIKLIAMTLFSKKSYINAY